MKRVDSPANPGFKALRRLVESSRERKRAGRSVLDGIHLVAAYCEHAGRPEQIYVTRRALEKPEVERLVAHAGGAGVTLLTDPLFSTVSSLVTPSGILAVIPTPRPRPIPGEMDACLMLEDLQDPGNLGSVLRSSAAAGMRHVMLSHGSVHAWSPRVLRAGMGAHFALSIYEGMDLPQAARAFGGRRLATLQRAPRTIYETDLTGRVALFLGNEGAGLTPALMRLADAVACIPMPGRAESLNVAAAAAVCLFERVRQSLPAASHGRQ